MVNKEAGYTRRLWLLAAAAPLASGGMSQWTLAGRTLSPRGRPIAKATVTLEDTLTTTRRTTLSGRRGSFQFKGLSLGVACDVSARLGDAVSATVRASPIDANRVVLIELRIPVTAG